MRIVMGNWLFFAIVFTTGILISNIGLAHTIENLNQRLELLENTIAQQKDGLNHVWLIIASALVMLMQKWFSPTWDSNPESRDP